MLPTCVFYYYLGQGTSSCQVSANGDVAVIFFRRPAVIGVVDIKIGERHEGSIGDKEMQTQKERN